VYEPSLIFVAQGRKTGYLGTEVFTYDPWNYLVLSVPLPLECEVAVSPRKPFLALTLKVTPALLGELLLEMDDDALSGEATPRGIYAAPLTRALSEALIRLTECLHSDLDCRMLGPQIVREVLYRVLCGERGATLRASAARNGHFSQISTVLRRIHAGYPQELDIETLARQARMSVSTFHHKFKSVTSTSPLQYVKSIRLHRARLLLAQDGLNASTAAARVGYESASQFSREFKRFFGQSPVEARKR
jgi:AraC-like DNA-binding protein